MRVGVGKKMEQTKRGGMTIKRCEADNVKLKATSGHRSRCRGVVPGVEKKGAERL